MDLQARIQATKVGRLDLIKYKYGAIRGVKFWHTQRLRAMDYEASGPKIYTYDS